MTEPSHGTYARYQRPHSCRCADCRAAVAAYQREWRRKNGSRDRKTQQRAAAAAVRLFRERFPDEWRRLLDDAYDQVTMGENT